MNFSFSFSTCVYFLYMIASFSKITIIGVFPPKNEIFSIFNHCSFDSVSGDINQGLTYMSLLGSFFHVWMPLFLHAPPPRLPSTLPTIATTFHWVVCFVSLFCLLIQKSTTPPAPLRPALSSFCRNLAGSGLFVFLSWLLSSFCVGCSCLFLFFCLFGVSDYSVHEKYLHANILHRNFLRFTHPPSQSWTLPLSLRSALWFWARTPTTMITRLMAWLFQSKKESKSHLPSLISIRSWRWGGGVEEGWGSN